VAAGFAGVVAMVIAARRLRDNGWLIAVPLVFVVGNLVATLLDFGTSGDPKALAPAGPETVFAVLYTVFATTRVRQVRS
jgi:hypothetical protein